MSHLIDTMAYTGQTPWHQLGHALPKKQSIDVWSQAAGMQWKIQETPVRYMAHIRFIDLKPATVQSSLRTTRLKVRISVSILSQTIKLSDWTALAIASPDIVAVDVLIL